LYYHTILLFSEVAYGAKVRHCESYHNLPNQSPPITEYQNKMWRYRVDDSTWTWISGSYTTNNAGSLNVPGARAGAVRWFDNTNQEFWVFGGQNNYGEYFIW